MDASTQAVAAASATGIEGLVFRPYAGEADIPEIVRIQNADWAADGLTYRESVEERAAQIAHPTEQFRPERDITIAEVGGRIVAHAGRDWVDTNDGLREYRNRGAVDPEWRRRGIGTALLRENIARNVELAAAQPTERQLVLGMWSDDRNLGAAALAKGAGFTPSRWFFDMERPNLDGDLPELPRLPDGIEVRPVKDDDLLTIWRADVEAFRDHWGGGDDSDEAFLRYRDAPDFDPSMWVVAWEGDEVVAAVVNTIYAVENAELDRKRGWLDSVFTRRAWRKRGIAGALIARSLHVLAQARRERRHAGGRRRQPLGCAAPVRVLRVRGQRADHRMAQADGGALVISAPAGLRIRPFDIETDLPSMVRILNAENETDGVAERATVEGERAQLANPSDQFDASRDLVVAELDGRMVGIAGQDWIDTRDGRYREHRLWGAVDPSYRRRGIGSALLADGEARATRLAATQPIDRPHTLLGFAAADRPGDLLLRGAGYELARWFFDMVRPDLEAIEEPPMPDGLELRPITTDLYERVWRANREAFRDHWGGSDESAAAMHRFMDGPDVDPSLWLIAFDGDEVAGGIINAISPEENEALGIQRGWLDSVFTRRRWRRRGLARALIGRSLRLLRDRGMTSAALGVDADNTSGALGLYEAAGFRIHDRFVAYRKPMGASRP